MAIPRPFRVRLGGGLNLDDPRSELKPGQLSLARNSFYPDRSETLAMIPGRSLFAALSNPASGMSYVRFRSGKAFLITATGSAFYTSPVGQGTWTSRTTGFTSVGNLQAVHFDRTDLAYAGDGVNPLQVWTGTGAMRNAGLTRPSAGTISELTNGGTVYPINTTFQYCHTEYDSTLDIESAPSPVVSLALGTASGTFKYTLPATDTNSSHDQYRIYRTQSGGDVFYRLATIDKTVDQFYDGTDSESLGNSSTTGTIFGFATIDDIYLSVLPIMPMIGKPLETNYITTNGTIPRGAIVLEFNNSLVITGIPTFPQDIYFSMQDRPETFPPVNFVRVTNPRGDPITGAGIANDRFVAFTPHSIYRYGAFPRVTDPNFGLGIASREEVTDDHGCIAKRTVVNFGIGQPNNRLFYLSSRGPAMTDGYYTYPLNRGLGWDKKFINIGAAQNAVAVNFQKYDQIWLFCPSRDSMTNDIAFIYHYHPEHLDSDGVGKWMGPCHIRAGSAVHSQESGAQSVVYTADTMNGNVYLEDAGSTDASNYDDSTGAILWEWITADTPLRAESKNKRAQRVYLSMGEDGGFDPDFKFAVNKASKEHPITLSKITQEEVPETMAMGTSTVTPVTTKSYRGGVWATGSHHRFHMKELSTKSRSIAALEVEMTPFGRQK